MNLQGIAINTFSPRKKMYPLVNAGLALNRSTDDILYTNFRYITHLPMYLLACTD